MSDVVEILNHQYSAAIQKHREEEAKITSQRERAEARILAAQNQIGRLNARLEKLYKSTPEWKEALVHPLADELAKLYPELTFQVIGPFGIGNEVAIHARRHRESGSSEEVVGSITFRPIGENNSLGVVDYGQHLGEYPKGSLGDRNGLNHPTVPVTELAQVVHHFQKSLDEHDS